MWREKSTTSGLGVLPALEFSEPKRGVFVQHRLSDSVSSTLLKAAAGFSETESWVFFSCTISGFSEERNRGNGNGVQPSTAPFRKILRVYFV